MFRRRVFTRHRLPIGNQKYPNCRLCTSRPSGLGQKNIPLNNYKIPLKYYEKSHCLMNHLFDISTPQKRERFLLVMAGVVFLIIMVPVFYRFFITEIGSLRKDRNRFKTEIEKYENDVKHKTEIKDRLDHFIARSLPSKDDFAKSLYQNYLMDLAAETGIRESRIDPGSVAVVKTQNKTHYNKYTFTLHGKGSLDKVAEFLRRFDKADYLHLIRKVLPRPIKNSREMDVSITIEALSLPQARSNRTLPKIDEQQLAVTDDDKAMLKRITERSLFSVFVPARAEPEPRAREEVQPPSRFDQSPYCYVIAVVEVNGKPQVWIDLRTEGKKFRLYEGEMFQLGTVRCFVRKIEFDRVQFEAAGGFYTIKTGKSFAEYE
ncbi:MAG: hypothetical protein LBU34_08235 [Planctomycetaceae bacterium]|jgi:flagellar motor protein MotB|nr:hypothetical protein [Planctomycetaceae bacterium]